MMTTIEIVVMLVGLFFAVSAFSFAWFPGNVFYEIAESVLIGGYCIMGLFAIIGSIWSTILIPMVGGKVLLIIPVITGLLCFARWTKYRWLARYSVAVSSGVGIGVLFGMTIKADIITQMVTAINDVVKGTPDIFTAWLDVVVLVCVMIYFTFSMKYSKTFHQGRLKYVSRIGRYFIYAAFGYGYSTIFVGEGLGSLIGAIFSMIVRPLGALLGK